MDPGDPDRSAVEAQLGREPRGAWRVARRCACGLPQVIETDPKLEDGTPFPTLWWLTCTRLVSLVSKLESDGWMAQMNDSLSSDPELREKLRSSTTSYIRARDSIDPLGASGHPGGGPERVKCLHAHTAHYLVTADNPVGEAVMRELDWSDPEAPCV